MTWLVYHHYLWVVKLDRKPPRILQEGRSAQGMGFYTFPAIGRPRGNPAVCRGLRNLAELTWSFSWCTIVLSLGRHGSGSGVLATFRHVRRAGLVDAAAVHVSTVQRPFFLNLFTVV